MKVSEIDVGYFAVNALFYGVFSGEPVHRAAVAKEYVNGTERN